MSNEVVTTFRLPQMGRIPLVDPDDPSAEPKARAVLGAVRAGLSRSELPWSDINVYRAIGNHPDALESILQLGGAVYSGGSLTPAHRELAWLGSSVANECHY